jgi:hypothetical protein
MPNVCYAFWREKSELKARFLFPKRKRELTFEHGGKKRRGKSADLRRPLKRSICQIMTAEEEICVQSAMV